MPGLELDFWSAVPDVLHLLPLLRFLLVLFGTYLLEVDVGGVEGDVVRAGLGAFELQEGGELTRAHRTRWKELSELAGKVGLGGVFEGFVQLLADVVAGVEDWPFLRSLRRRGECLRGRLRMARDCRFSCCWLLVRWPSWSRVSCCCLHVVSAHPSATVERCGAYRYSLATSRCRHSDPSPATPEALVRPESVCVACWAAVLGLYGDCKGWEAGSSRDSKRAQRKKERNREGSRRRRHINSDVPYQSRSDTLARDLPACSSNQSELERHCHCGVSHPLRGVGM